MEALEVSNNSKLQKHDEQQENCGSQNELGGELLQKSQKKAEDEEVHQNQNQNQSGVNIDEKKKMAVDVNIDDDDQREVVQHAPGTCAFQYYIVACNLSPKRKP